MRLIDADALIDEIQCNVGVESSRWDSISDIVDMINEQPTAQQKQGHWIKYNMHRDYPFKCSECHCYHRGLYDYCPNCGARMITE